MSNRITYHLRQQLIEQGWRPPDTEMVCFGDLRIGDEFVWGEEGEDLHFWSKVNPYRGQCEDNDDPLDRVFLDDEIVERNNGL